MGRLIDADAFVKEYSQISEKFRNNEIMRMMIDHFIDAVKTFPTAYDVDKVVEEMNEALIKLGGGNDCSRCAFREICDRGCIETMIEVYKSIARKGGA